LHVQYASALNCNFEYKGFIQNLKTFPTYCKIASLKINDP